MRNNRNQDFNWSPRHEKADSILGNGFWNEISSVIPKFGPNIDMYEDEEEVVVVIETPGLAVANQISAKLKGFKLLVSGNIPCTYPINGQNLLQRERFTGEFKRELELPADIDPYGKIIAQQKNGLIEIHIPKIPPKDEKDISILFLE